jgi:uncharacterized protein YkwD
VVGLVAMAAAGSCMTAKAAGGDYLAPATLCPGQTAASAPAAVEQRAMRCLVNWARRRRGLTSVRPSARLDRSAALRAEAIRRCRDFSHSPCGSPFTSVFAQVGYWRGRAAVGENLAWADFPTSSPRKTVADWLASPQHRQILFTPSWREGGIALLQADGLFGRPRVAVWVSQFGRRR